MPSSQILSLPGMADVTGGSFERSTRVVDALGAYYASRGYAPIDTPIVEDAELFVRKSGGELSGMLYTFDDPGGNRVSLRPEFTPSVIRHYVEQACELGTPGAPALLRPGVPLSLPRRRRPAPVHTGRHGAYRAVRE